MYSVVCEGYILKWKEKITFSKSFCYCEMYMHLAAQDTENETVFFWFYLIRFMKRFNLLTGNVVCITTQIVCLHWPWYHFIGLIIINLCLEIVAVDYSNQSKFRSLKPLMSPAMIPQNKNTLLFGILLQALQRSRDRIISGFTKKNLWKGRWAC